MADFDTELLRGSGFEGGRLRIRAFFEQNPSEKEAIRFLKDEYGTGGHSMKLSDGTAASADHSPKGLKFTAFGDVDREVVFSWAQVASRLRTVAFDDRYLSEDEKSRLEEVRASLSARTPAETKDMSDEIGTTLFSALGEADSVEFGRDDALPFADEEPVTETTYGEEAIDDVPAQSAAGPENFRITDDELGYGGPKAKFRMNTEAIRTLKRPLHVPCDHKGHLQVRRRHGL